MAFQFKYLDAEGPLLFNFSFSFASNPFFSISNFLFNWQLINLFDLLLLVCTLTTLIVCFILQPPLKYTIYSNHPQHMLEGTSYSRHFILLMVIFPSAWYSRCFILQALCTPDIVCSGCFKHLVLPQLHTLCALYSGHLMIKY